jgi:TonB-linked SusC/RagA family outer membrane protein
MKLILNLFSLFKGKLPKKLMLTMKLSVILSLAAILNVSASVYSQNKKLSIQVENIQLRDLFREIENNTEYAFFFNDRYSELEKLVTLESRDERIESVLDRLLSNTSLDYKILENNFVVIVPKEEQQQVPVTGKVVDSDGMPLPGVNVVEKGTTNGAVTDIDGNYSIVVSSAEATLAFSSVGYLSEEVVVGSQSTINMTLAESIESLEEVVVVGYGTMKKSDVTGALVSVDEEALREVPVPSIQQALQGRAAGLEVQRVGTAPGAGVQIRIRGDRSITGSNGPLVVLDGIPYEGGTLNDVDPNAIASVEVLKDASATAIYGSRGANGVILITTKRGKAGETSISYNGYYGVTTIARKYKMFNAEEYAASRDAGSGSWGYMPEELEMMKTGKSTDWQDLMYQNGMVTDQNLNVTGGNETTQFSLGGSYYRETTILAEQDFTRYSVRANIDTKIGDRLRVGLNTLNSVNVSNGTQFVNQQANVSGFDNIPYGGSIMFPILTLSPLMPPYDTNGEILVRPGGNPEDRENQYNPLLIKQNNGDWVDLVRRMRSFNTLYAEVDLFKGLKYRINVGLDFRQTEFDQFQARDSYFRTRDQSARARVCDGAGWGYTVENLLMYQNTFADKHSLNITGLFSAQQDKQHETGVGKEGITADFLEFYDLNQSDPQQALTLHGDEKSWGLLSYMLRVNYNFNDRLLLTLTGRADGSSRLAEKWHYYPAVSAGWNVHNESFLKNQNVLSTLKIRVGWGETSNQSVDPYSTLGGVTGYQYQGTVPVPIRYNYGVNQQVSGYLINKIADKTLDWEYTRTTNLGLDFGFLSNRISGTVEYYTAKTYNLLYEVTLPVSSGIADPFLTNVGKIENKGFEFTISSVNVRTQSGFTWSMDLNIFLNRNKLNKMYKDLEMDVQKQLHIGYPLNAIYDYEKLGIWQLDEAEEAAIYGQLPGQLKIRDLNNDSTIDADNDRKVIGSGEADWQGGLTNRFTFKGFDLSIVAYGRFGGTLVSYLHQPARGYFTMLDGRRNALKVDYWTPDNPTNWFAMPQATNNYTIVPPNASSAWTTLGYYDATFVKIRSISLGYTLPKRWVSKVNIKNLRVYATAQNPFLLFCPYVTDYNGVDPEPTGSGTIGGVGEPNNLRYSGNNKALVIGGSTPPTKSLIFGINVTL